VTSPPCPRTFGANCRSSVCCRSADGVAPKKATFPARLWQLPGEGIRIVTRFLLLLTTCVAVSPALALDQRRPPCPATEVAPGVKMRTGGCPMMFLPADHDPDSATRSRANEAPGPWLRSAEPSQGPGLPVRQSDGSLRP
jgi:hypothetical protein